MALKQLGKSRAMPAVAVLIAAGKATSGLPWVLAISLMLAPFILLTVLIFITAIFGRQKLQRSSLPADLSTAWPFCKLMLVFATVEFWPAIVDTHIGRSGRPRAGRL